MPPAGHSTTAIDLLDHWQAFLAGRDTSPFTWHYSTFGDFLDHWQSLLAGGLALIAAVITLLGLIAIERWKVNSGWRRRPILLAEYGEAGDGSLIHEDTATSSDGSIWGKNQWARIRVRNKGRSTARNVRVMIVSLGNKTSDASQWDYRQEIIDCWWSHIDESKIDIPPDTWRFADLFLLKMSNAKSILRFTGVGARNIPGRIEHITIGVKITADNCDTTEANLTLRYLGLEKGMSFEP